jgi:hypothetical protein
MIIRIVTESTLIQVITIEVMMYILRKDSIIPPVTSRTSQPITTIRLTLILTQADLTHLRLLNLIHNPTKKQTKTIKRIKPEIRINTPSLHQGELFNRINITTTAIRDLSSIRVNRIILHHQGMITT